VVDEPLVDPRGTARCLRDDLGFADGSESRPTAELADEDATGLLAGLIRRAAAGGEGQEPIRSLLPEIQAFSLHSGRHRGATWLHREARAVWLLAAGYHREGARDDAYEYFAQLKAARIILPTRHDLEALERARDRTFAVVLTDELPQLVDHVRAHPGDVVEHVLGGRVALRAVYEEGDPGLLTLAIDVVVQPGDLPLPPEWSLIILGAAFPGWALEELEVTDDVGGHPRRDTELVFCGFDVAE
jgi:hypothetical protein